ncbi:hypothetical protein ACFZBU_06665 [Embleya sp. NPDC008237]
MTAEDTYPTDDGFAGLRKLTAEEVPPAPAPTHLADTHRSPGSPA